MSEGSRIEPKRPRGTGCIYQQKGSSNWWIQYYRNGKAYRQSAGTTERRKAERFLQRKLGEIATAIFWSHQLKGCWSKNWLRTC